MGDQPVGTPNTRIGYMLQKDHLLEWRSIYRNIILGLEIRHQLTPAKKELADQMLATHGLDKFRNARPSQLSGGMRQRAALNPCILLLKPEALNSLLSPFLPLIIRHVLNVSDDIGKILKKENKPAILVTHDIGEAISMADRVVILSKRPAVVKKIIPIELGLKDRTPMSSRNASLFKYYFNLIWKELNQNE